MTDTNNVASQMGADMERELVELGEVSEETRGLAFGNPDGGGGWCWC